jgi:hypothetical protein
MAGGLRFPAPAYGIFSTSFACTLSYWEIIALIRSKQQTPLNLDWIFESYQTT